jgi:hypothetical protein
LTGRAWRSNACLNLCRNQIIVVVQSPAKKEDSMPFLNHNGTYCFYFWDADDNAWEILSNPEGGYSWGFALGDQTGVGHMSRQFARPASTLTRS